jgi:hypothetical protein
MKTLLLLLCINNYCHTAHELELCVPHDLSQECTTTYEGGNINLAGNITYPANAITYDQWFSIEITEYVTVTIDLLSDYSHPLATLGNYGLLEGIKFIMYTGDCENLTPILFTGSPLGSGQYCGATQYDTNPCPFPQSNWTCNGCLESVQIGSLPYIATLQAMPQCCNGWTSQCNNEYNAQVIFYNTAMSGWTWQNGLGELWGLCPFDPTVQNIEITMNLAPGTYYFQVFPFNNIQQGYVSEGEGTLNVCAMGFLSIPEDDEPPRPIKPSEAIHEPRYTKVVIEGRGVFIRDNHTGEVYDILTREQR